MSDYEGYEATIGFRTGDEQDTALQRIRSAIETHPTLSLILDYALIRSVTNLKEAERLALQHKDIEDLDKEVEQLRAQNKHLEAKLKLSETNENMNKRALRELNSRYEAVVMQLEKLAQHKEPRLVPETEGVLALMEDYKRIDAKLRESEKQVSYLEGVRAESGARFIFMRERIWELENGIGSEQVTVVAERDFWREKAKSLMKKS